MIPLLSSLLANVFLLLATALPLLGLPYNILICGRTRGGKTLAAARSALEDPREARVDCDPHKDSYGRALLTHLTGNVLYDCLSDRHGLPYDLLVPSDDPDPEVRADQNYRRAVAFVAILLRLRDAEGLTGTPLMEE